MEKLLPLFGVLAVLFAVIGVVWVIASKLGLLKKPTAVPDEDVKGAAALGYRTRDEVLSPGERAFYPALREAAKMLAAERKLPTPIVLASVRLAEVLSVASAPGENRSAWQSAFNKIASKQADFVLCEPESTRPLLVVELDDATHGRTDRQDRDGFVDRACGSAGLPILHVRAAASYSPQALAREMAAALPDKRG